MHTKYYERDIRHVHFGLEVGFDWFLSGSDLLGPRHLDLLGPRHLDPTKYFKIFKYVMGPNI